MPIVLRFFGTLFAACPPAGNAATDDAYTDASDDNETPLPAVININTADSATLVKFRGIGPATARKIIIRIKTEGPFTDIDQLRELYSFPEETFQMLKKHLVTRDYTTQQ